MIAMDWPNEGLREKLFVPGRKAASALSTGRYFTLDRTSFVSSRSKLAVYRSNIRATFLPEHHLQGERFFKHCLLTLMLLASPVLWSRAQLVTEVYETCTAVEGEIARCGPGANCFIIGGVPTCHCILDVATGLPLAGNPYKACTWDISGNWQLFSHYSDKKDVEKEKKPKAGSMRQVLSPLSNEPFIVRLDRTDALLRTRLASPGEFFLMRETTSQSFSNKLKALLITSGYWTRRISKEAGKKTTEPWLRSMLHKRRGTGRRSPTFVQLGWYGALRFGSNRIDIYSPATGEPIYSLLRVDTLPSFTPSGAPAMQELFKPTTKEVVMMPSSTQFQISVDPPKMPLNLIVADAERGMNNSGGEMAFTKRHNALDDRDAFAEAQFREEMRGDAEELMAAASDILAGLTRFTT
ncbi:UNVERIFIED_CONTAM: hypothetical protein HHA_240470 [Hammondia hammondi]|eukprot:XP_008887862.1 hypothetical protein HHA_240470 [Hammondia hammondi]